MVRGREGEGKGERKDEKRKVEGGGGQESKGWSGVRSKRGSKEILSASVPRSKGRREKRTGEPREVNHPVDTVGLH